METFLWIGGYILIGHVVALAVMRLIVVINPKSIDEFNGGEFFLFMAIWPLMLLLTIPGIMSYLLIEKNYAKPFALYSKFFVDRMLRKGDK